MSDVNHGSIYTYRKGCRCTPCVQANYRAQARWRDKVARKPVPPHVHGTINGYKVYMCRCDDCKAAKAVSDAAAKKRRMRIVRLVAAGLPLDYDGEV